MAERGPTMTKIENAAHHDRKASLSEVEEVFLRALLIDPPRLPVATEVSPIQEDEVEDEHDESSKENVATQLLSDDVLFMVPHTLKKDLPVPKYKRPSGIFRELWHAFEDGVNPKALARRGTSPSVGTFRKRAMPASPTKEHIPRPPPAYEDEDGDTEEDETSVASDQEVRPERDCDSTDSSLDDEECGVQHYDTWEVLKDEYSRDFGFDFTDHATSIEDINAENDSTPHMFRILGTTADDLDAQPHVLSPPIMDSLLSFVPESLSNSNFWLKYSLVRDGACFETLKTYIRASTFTVIAIETVQGDVFGSFTSSPWQNAPRYFGAAPAFLWKMRHSRRTPCHSLFDQAQMESELDVYFYSGVNNFVQFMNNDCFGVGGGELPGLEGTEESEDKKGKHYGFGIALNEDLLSGTSSRCGTFRNPCLASNRGSKGETFEVANLEVWSFTPCMDIKSAERLEMTKYFANHSVFSFASSSTMDSSAMSSTDALQDEFFRRVGHNDRHEEFRDRWQYMSMMNSSASSGGGGMHSPRYSS